MYILKINFVLDGEKYKKGDILPDVPDKTLELLLEHGFVNELSISEGKNRDEDSQDDATYLDEKKIRSIKSKKKLAEYAESIGLELSENQSMEKMQDEIINFIEEKEAGVL